MAGFVDLLARASNNDREAQRDLLRMAAAGSLQVQRAILDGILGGAAPGAVERCELLARMVAARGDVNDALRLCSILFLLQLTAMQAGEIEDVQEHQAEILLILRELADAGEGEALQALAFYAPQFTQTARDAAGMGAGEPVRDWDSPRPPPIFATNILAPSAGRWGALGVWLVDRQWDLRFAWWKLSDWMRGL